MVNPSLIKTYRICGCYKAALTQLILLHIASVPFLPPKILKIKCGKLLGDYELCVILKQVQINWPVDVPWSSFGYIPYKFNAALSFEVVYNSAELPGQSRILKLGL